jgi:cytidylate kinase
MTRQQRRIGERGQVVMVGRDIGTVVLPNAELKLYLDASVEERARRRMHDFQAEGLAESYESILAAMRERDRKDSTRTVAPLRAAEDAIQIDTTEIEMDDLLGVVLDLLNSRTPEGEDGL